jgi:hypothetical protein
MSYVVESKGPSTRKNLLRIGKRFGVQFGAKDGL